MKKVLIILLIFIIFISIGCSKEDNKSTYDNSSYSFETAIENGDVVVHEKQQYNVEKLDEFMKNIEKGNNDKLRIAFFSSEDEDMIITEDLEYDGKKIYLTSIIDNYLDVKDKEFDSSSFYKKGSSYYLKNSPNDVYIF